MNHKLIIADQASTTLKVLQVALLNGPYDIIHVTKEHELWENLKNVKAALLLVDFNFKNGKSLELCRSVSHEHPKLPMGIIYGAFDDFDKEKFISSNALKRFVKPLDSDKLKEDCIKMIELNFDGADHQETDDAGEFELKDWVIENSFSGATKVEETMTDDIDSFNTEDELSGWGIEIPGVIGQEDALGSFDQILMPPQIRKRKSDITAYGDETEFLEVDLQALELNEAKIPTNDKLEYPEIDDKELNKEKADGPTKSTDTDTKEDEGAELDRFKDLKLSSSLIPLNELKLEEKESENVSHFLSDRDLLKEIQDDLPKNDKWSIGESTNKKGPNTAEQENDQKLGQEIELILKKAKDKIGFTDFASEKKNTNSDINIKHDGQMVNINELEKYLRPIIVKEVESYLKATAERIAWEILPDVAENIIRSEIQNIKNSLDR